MSNAHHCHAVGCDVPVPPKMHMCLKHWRMVPKAVQDLIWKHYRPGQEIDKRPTTEYLCTVFVSISCVAMKEGKPMPILVASYFDSRNERRLPQDADIDEDCR